MSGFAGRPSRLLVLAALAFAVTASSGAAASPARTPMLGVVPHAGGPPTGAVHGPSASAAGTASGGDVFLQDSPCSPTSCWVMRTNTTYAIYWVPAGYSVDAGYESLVNQYLSDVAAASGSQTNVYSVATQYYDATGWIAYQSTFGGSDVDTDAFPTSGCHDGVDSVCLTDQQLETEIAKVITAKGWPTGPDSLFVIMTPQNVGSCYDGVPPPDGQCSTNYFCAYHSGFDLSGQPVLYANEPYAAGISGCGAGSSPNNDDADSTINTISHEQNEAITDPAGNAWLNSGGDEIADICAWNFGPALGGTANVDAYNQVINGHHYWLQQEYSNDGSICRQHYVGKPANTALPALSGLAVQGKDLTVGAGSWTQVPTGYAYQWLRCSATGTDCVPIAGATSTTYVAVAADAGHTLEASVTATNAAGVTSAVSKPSVPVVGVPTILKSPRIRGRLKLGRRLVAGKGSWAGPPTTYRFQWLRCNSHGGRCVRIRRATHSTYRLTKHESRHRLRVQVTAANVAGSGTVTSRPTGRVPTKKR